MSFTFSFSRLGKLIAKQFVENLRLYIFSILALIALLALVFTIWLGASSPRYHEEATYMIFLFGLFISGAIFSSMSFSMLGNKNKGIYWLSVPATHFEKLLCTIFYTTVVFTVVYCLCFYLVKSVAIAFLLDYIASHTQTSYTKLNTLDNEFGEAVKYFLLAFFAVQSLYQLGSVYFSRYSFVITTVVGAVVLFAFGYYITVIQRTMGGTWDLLELSKHDPSTPGVYQLYTVSPFVSDLVKYVVQFAWVPVFWLVTWFRLKEKQV